MPPEVSHCPPTVTPSIQFLPQQPPPRSLPPHHKLHRGTKKMIITKKKLIPVLVFTLSGFSILRLLKISVTTSFSSPFSTALPPPHLRTKTHSTSSLSSAALTDKEHRLLSSIVSLRAPCNLLVFGLEPQYLNISKINTGGNNVFLEDDPGKLDNIQTDHSSTRIYPIGYQTVARDAYELLKRARQDRACGLKLNLGLLKESSCPLALKRLPEEVYKRRWDVVVVDGPSGDSPDSPGRMAAIYTAGVIARAGNGTDVVVHDTDRMIEKWFAWEFLCDENLVSSKGKLWNFRIGRKSNSMEFCPARTVLIE